MKYLLIFVLLLVSLSARGMDKIQIQNSDNKYSGDFVRPTGAKDFEVDLPRLKEGSVLNLAEIGVSESSQNFIELVNSAIERCKRERISKLVLPKGVYKITEGVPISFDGLSDFEFDGGGSTLVFKKENGDNFLVRNCTRVKLSNFNMDWDWKTDPLASLVEVTGVNADGDKSYVDFKFLEYDDFPNKQTRMVNVSAYDTKNACVGYEGGFSAYFHAQSGAKMKNPKNEWIAPNVVRINFDPSVRYANTEVFKRFKTGQIMRMQHYYYHMNGMRLTSNEHLSLKDINFYSCAGHAIVVGGKQKYWSLENVNIKRPDYAPERVITCTGDHMHISQSRGFLKMKNCEFSLGADDCINMHDNTGFARKASENSIHTQNARVVNTYVIGDPIELRQGDYSPSGFCEPIAKISVIDKDKGEFEIFFDKPVPDQTLEGFIMFNRAYGTRNVMIDSCKFWGNRARGILVLASDVTIKNSVFYHHEFGGIKLETGYTFDRWSEGYGVDNVLIQNNKFESVCTNSAWHDIFIGVYMKKDPSSVYTDYPIISNILFQGNTFTDSFGYIAIVSCVQNLTFEGNTFKNSTGRISNAPHRGGFLLNYSKNIRIIDNIFESSAYADYSIYYDPKSVENLIIEGNSVR